MISERLRPNPENWDSQFSLPARGIWSLCCPLIDGEDTPSSPILSQERLGLRTTIHSPDSCGDCQEKDCHFEDTKPKD